MSTTNHDWHTLDRHLDSLLDLPDEQREASLTQLAQDDAGLATTLRRLLEGISRSDSIERLAASAFCAEALSRRAGLGSGHVLGSWTLLAHIGHGGMADVFEAQRHVNGARQRVAIKVMSLGMSGSEQTRRFQQETEILARLDDARLSRLIDAGVAPDGRPWLAMEFVEGEALDRGCDRRQLSIEARVRCVIDVALAVDYAHRQLVVHRDLKPGNILLAQDGQVRLLDFGIAKILSPDATEPESTQTLARAYTLRYASPEQLAGKPTGVASDVYQIGLLLHVLLTGVHPFAAQGDDPLKLLQAMRGSLRPPSSAVASNTASAAARASTPARLRRQLHGDLDSILLHALQADPEARYRGARELAEDLLRWLDRKPILARPFSRTYRARRFLRRHWLGAASVSTIALLLIGYAATVTWHSARLTEERNAAQQAQLRAESVKQFLLDVFGSADPDNEANRGKSAGEILERSLDRVDQGFAQQPELAAQLMIDIGEIFLGRSQLDAAERAFTRAVQLREATLADDDPSLALARLYLAILHEMRGNDAQAKQMALAYLAAFEGKDNPPHELIAAYRLLSKLDSKQGNTESAERLLDKALSFHGSVYGSAPWAGIEANEHYVRIVHDHALILLRGKRYIQAEPLLAEAVRAHIDTFGPQNALTLAARKNLAYAWRSLERTEDARREFLSVLEDERKIYDAASSQIAYTMGHVANTYSDSKNFAAAAAWWKDAEREARASLGDEHPWIATARLRHAQALLLNGQVDDAYAILVPLSKLTDRQGDIAGPAAKLMAEHPRPEK